MSVDPPASAAAGPSDAPAGAAAGPGIVLRGVRKAFGEVIALEGIDLEIGRHARIGIVGPSGGGKSTLLSIVSGLLAQDSGEVVVQGAVTPRDRLRMCALMPQRDLLLPWRSALDNACLALENRGVSRREARRRARPLFEHFGLGQFESRSPSQLSGGMRQRVSFLRTLMAEKDVLLLDEPFGALDSITRAQMQEWLVGALDEVPRTVLLVTHDVEEALLLTSRVVVLSARPGRVVRTFDTTFTRAADPPRDGLPAGLRGAARRGPRGARVLRAAAPARRRTGGALRATGRWCRRALFEYGPAVLLLAALIGLWELLIRWLNTPEYLLPAPSAVARNMYDEWGLLSSNLWTTVEEVILGFLIAVAAGLLLAIVLHLSGILRRAVYPLLIASQTVPVVVLAPILVILLGYNIKPKLVIVALICFFPIVVNGVDGLRSVDPEFPRMMRTLDASRLGIFRRVEFPSALPSIFSGVRIAATFAAIGAVFAEWSGSTSGLGYLMQSATPSLATARIVSAIVLLSAISLILFLLVFLVERLTIPWARGAATAR